MPPSLPALMFLFSSCCLRLTVCHQSGPRGPLTTSSTRRLRRRRGGCCVFLGRGVRPPSPPPHHNPVLLIPRPLSGPQTSGDAVSCPLIPRSLIADDCLGAQACSRLLYLFTLRTFLRRVPTRRGSPRSASCPIPSRLTAAVSTLDPWSSSTMIFWGI